VFSSIELARYENMISQIPVTSAVQPKAVLFVEGGRKYRRNTTATELISMSQKTNLHIYKSEF
jgi:hypothetical protein